MKSKAHLLKRAIWLKSLFLTACLLLATIPAFSQTKTVTGTVTDAAGDALIGVSILVQGSNNGVWNDIGWPTQSEEMMPYFLAHYYNKVPEGVVNDRFNGRYHDFLTKEYKSGSVNRNEKWEMCRGMGLSFGYNANEGDDKLISVPDLISLLVGTVANNGNLLLNIGPKADGTIPEEQVRRLKILGCMAEGKP